METFCYYSEKPDTAFPIVIIYSAHFQIKANGFESYLILVDEIFCKFDCQYQHSLHLKALSRQAYTQYSFE